MGLLAAFAAVGSYAEVSVKPVPGDPLTLQPPPGGNPGFGRAVAISGDTMVVGHPYTFSNTGSVSIYIRNTPGEESSGWTQLGCPSACSTGILYRTGLTMNYEQFGWSVAIDGDTIIVGAVDDVLAIEGKVVVFERDTPGSLTSTWSQVAELRPNPTQQSDRFGYSLSISGDTLVASTREKDDNVAGKVFVFVRDPDAGWVQSAKLEDPLLSGPLMDPAAMNTAYGSSVSISGNTVAISAPNEYLSYVAIFVRSDPGDLKSTWTAEQVIKPEDDGFGKPYGFGKVVAIDGDTLVASSHVYHAYRGAAWVFTRRTTADGAGSDEWLERAELKTAATSNLNDMFGTGLAISGDTIVVGNIGFNVDSGLVEVFTRESPGTLTSGWSSAGALNCYGVNIGEKCGFAVAVDKNTILAGTSAHEKAFVFYTTSTVTISQMGADVSLLSSTDVSLSGDGNHLAVLTCMTYDFDTQCDNLGKFVRVFKWDCESKAWAQMGANLTETNSNNNQFGMTFKLSHDGTRLAVSSQGSNHVTVFQWVETSSSWVQLGDLIFGEAAGDLFGESMDISGDGNVIAVMAPNNDGNGEASGSVRVYEWKTLTTSWQQIGQDIDGPAAFNYGGGVSISFNGTFLAAGHYYNSDTWDKAGTVRVWKRSTGSCGLEECWSQVGDSIYGPGTNARSGGRNMVSLSSDGTKVAISAYNVPNGNVRVFSWEYDAVLDLQYEWTLMGSVIQGDGQSLGYAVSLSGDGTRLAINSATSAFDGLHVYEWNSEDWISQALQYDFPNSARTHVSLSSDGTRVAISESTFTEAEGKSARVYELNSTISSCPSSQPPEAQPNSPNPQAGSPESPSSSPTTPSPSKEENKKKQAEKTRDAILGDITNTRLKAKAKLLADAAIAGVKVKRLKAKLTADSEDTACSDAFTKAGMSASDGACVATAASSRKRRSLSSTTYDVELMFSSSTVSDDALAAAELEMKNNGVEGVSSDTAVDPIAELKTVPGVDTSKLQTFETEASDAADAAAESAAPPPAPPPPKPNLVLDDDDGAIHIRALTSALLATALALVALT